MNVCEAVATLVADNASAKCDSFFRDNAFLDDIILPLAESFDKDAFVLAKRISSLYIHYDEDVVMY